MDVLSCKRSISNSRLGCNIGEMTMKKKISLVILALCMLAITAISAVALEPLVISGKTDFNGAIYSNAQITIKDDYSNTWYSYTNANGVYIIDASNLAKSDGGYVSGGNYLTLSVCPATVTGCSQRVQVSNIPQVVNFGVDADPTIPDEPEVEVDTTTSDITKTSTNLDVYYGQSFDVIVAHNKISKLLDEEIEFDSDDYAVEEIVSVNGNIQTSLDDVDYGLIPYLIVDELTYDYVFKDLIDLTEISEDNSLVIDFLGQSIEIIDASASEITIIKGEEYLLKEGEIKSIEGKDLEIVTIGEGYVYVKYNGESEKIDEGNVGSIGGIEVYAKEVMADDDSIDLVTIRVSSNVKITIQDGDDYSSLEEFEWVVNMPNTIGIKNQDQYDDLEDQAPLTIGSKISLPHDFLDIKFGAITDVTMYDLDIEIDNGLLEVNGDLTKGTVDYDTIYVKATGFYDEDDVLISADSVQIGDSDISLELGSLKIGDLEIELDMSDITYAGVSYALSDDDYLVYEGIIFKNPEDAVNDKDNFAVSVPEQRPEVTIVIGEDLTSDVIVIDDDTIIVDDDVVVNVCPECIATVCDECVECEQCPVCPEQESNLLAGIMAIIAAAGLSGGVTYYMRKNYSTVKGVTVKTRLDANGKSLVEHLHRGLRNYHDPKTSHREVHERHPRGELYPLYEKDADGVYNYVGE